jgi:RNA polymerase sigma-70 factor (ECF subfamily)
MQSLINQSEDELFILCREGNERAFAALFERLRELLFNQAFYTLKNEEEAKDVVQDVFIWIWKHPDQEVSSGIRAYLRGAVRNQCAGRIRKNEQQQNKHLKFVRQAPTYTNEAPLEQKQLGEQITAALNLVGPAGRTAFTNLHIEEKSLKEIAAEMKINVQSVKNHIYRTSQFLRKNLKKN